MNPVLLYDSLLLSKLVSSFKVHERFALLGVTIVASDPGLCEAKSTPESGNPASSLRIFLAPNPAHRKKSWFRMACSQNETPSPTLSNAIYTYG